MHKMSGESKKPELDKAKDSRRDEEFEQLMRDGVADMKQASAKAEAVARANGDIQTAEYIRQHGIGYRMFTPDATESFVYDPLG